MAVYKQPKSNNWSYKFTFNGKQIRVSTKQTNQRVARQIESAHRTALAKGEVGIRDRKPVPTLADFAKRDFLPYVRSTFVAKAKTRAYYECGVKSLLAYDKLAGATMDTINTQTIAGFVAKRQEAGLMVASINRELQVLRRMFVLAQEWGKVEKVLPKVRMVPGERHRERVLTPDEEARYLGNAQPLLRDVATILIDCGLRPEECFRLRWESIGESEIEIRYGKTDNARRRVHVSPRVQALLDMRQSRENGCGWVFPAQTSSGHIEPCSVKRQHTKACKGLAKDDRQTGEKRFEVEPFPLYTLRHTCLTRWAPHMDPWTLAYLAGHRDMSITKRYVHPQAATVRQAIDRARVAQGGHTSGHTDEVATLDQVGDTAAKA